MRRPELGRRDLRLPQLRRPELRRPELTSLKSPVLAGVIDAVLVLVFAAVGRASHDEHYSVLGTVATAWPFLVGAAAGWGLVRWRSHRWPVDLGPGIIVWLATVVIGMLLRAVSGQGTAAAFVVVATVILGLVLLGWRAAARWVLNRTITPR